MKLCLVEEYYPNMRFDNDSLIVALTPEVCYRLDKAGIGYSIIEDYYDEAELLAKEDEYYQSQLQWLDELDEFLQSTIKELTGPDLRLGAAYYYYLKTMVLDPVYVQCYTLARLVESTRPSAIAFVSRLPREKALDFRLQGDDRSYCSQIVPIVCRENSIPFTPVFLEEDRCAKQLEPVGTDMTYVNKLKIMLGKRKAMRRLYLKTSFVLEYLRRRAFSKQASKEKLHILILRPGYNIGSGFVVAAQKRGHSVYELSDDLVMKYSAFGARRYSKLKTRKTSVSGSNDDIWERTADLLESTDLVRRINEQCRMDVSDIVLPKLGYFVSKVCPLLFAYFQAMIGFLDSQRIDFVIVPYAQLPIEEGALAAAGSRGITRVCICHGDDVFAGKFWRNLELSKFDVLICSNTEAKENYTRLSETHGISAELYTSPHRLSNVVKIGRLRATSQDSIKKGRIIYLPTMIRGNYRRFDNNYPGTWYYEFQKSLIEYFSTKRDYTFVWKGLPQSDESYNPIPNFIRDNGFCNIEIATNPFVEHLLSADRVICDYPSTGFYESVVAGVPTMSLYHQSFRVRTSAVRYFGNLLRLYSDIPEAKKHIDEFLDSDPGLYKATIEMGHESVVQILEDFREKRVPLTV